MKSALSLAAAILATSTPALVAAQQSGVTTFVVVQGKDTLHVEQYERVGNTITGAWIFNQGHVAVHQYVLTLGVDGLPTHYHVIITHPYGDVDRLVVDERIDFSGDSATVADSGRTVSTRRVAVNGGAFPDNGNYVMRFDLALAHLRAAQADSGAITFFSSGGNSPGPNGPIVIPPAARSVATKFVGADSAIVGPAHVAVDHDGRLLGARIAGGLEARRSGTPVDVPKFVARIIAAAAAADSARTVALPVGALDRFPGVYSQGNIVVVVTRVGDRLYVKFGQQPIAQLFAESPTSFFIRGNAATYGFETDGTGNVSAFVLRQGPLQNRIPKTR